MKTYSLIIAPAVILGTWAAEASMARAEEPEVARAPREEAPALLGAPGCVILERPGERSSHVLNTWPGAVVPFVFSPTVSTENQQRTLEVMADISEVSVVEFVARTTEGNYLNIRNGSSNSSFIGMIGGGQSVSILDWPSRRVIMHELMHALGFHHEHQRPDRDSYIQLVPENIDPGAVSNFGLNQNAIIWGPYDFASVTHYSQCSASICNVCASNAFNCRTIIVLPPNDGWQFGIGQRGGLSIGDVNGLRHLYGGGCTPWNDRDRWSCAADLTVLGHSPLHPAGFDIRDAFGGEFSQQVLDRGSIVFSDASGSDAVDWIEWQTASPVWIGRCEILHASDSASVDRGLGSIRLLSWSDVGEHWVEIGLVQSPPLAGLPTVIEANGVIASRFRAEFSRHPDASGSASGPRIVELNAFPQCAADWNRDFVLGAPDIFAFISAWFSADIATDLDGLHGVYLPDLFLYLQWWFEGC